MTAILLDAMGTLVTFEPPSPRLRALLASRHGVEVSLAQAEAAMRAEIAVYRAEHDTAVDLAALAALRLRCATVLRDALGSAAAGLSGEELVPTLLDSLHFVAYPEVPDVLRELRAAGHRLAVVSNWDVSLHEVLESTGLRGLVDAVLTSAEVGAAKPDPALFVAALRELGVQAADALHVGDTPEEDLDGARAAGVRCVLLAREGARSEVDAPVLADLRGLPALAA